MKDLLLCFGLGYVAKNLINSYKIKYLCTTSDGREGYKFNENTNFVIPELITHILISIPPIKHQDIVLNKMSKVVSKLPNLKWVGYLSATSVYGDVKGEWVTETSDANPIDERGIDRLNAEKLWLSQELPIHIFRLSGIYGKGRSVIDQILAGQARRIHKENHVFSRIHISDIVSCIISSMNNPKPYSIYNLGDDFPCSNVEVVEYGCKLLNKDFPILERYEQAEMSHMLRSFYSSSRRVSNDKIKNELKVELKYPTYQEGIVAILNEMKLL